MRTIGDIQSAILGNEVCGWRPDQMLLVLDAPMRDKLEAYVESHEGTAMEANDNGFTTYQGVKLVVISALLPHGWELCTDSRMDLRWATHMWGVASRASVRASAFGDWALVALLIAIVAFGAWSFA